MPGKLSVENGQLNSSDQSVTGPALIETGGVSSPLVRQPDNLPSKLLCLSVQMLDVLEQQERAAGLPGAIIATVLNQLGVNVLNAQLNSSLAMTNLIKTFTIALNYQLEKKIIEELEMFQEAYESSIVLSYFINAS
ncbi:hypothetical protein KIN20_005997 [Parelaphostrongylus tenuis]|uniref:Uncharacterized protein n=1 Tax=Parelaphostrongylus tenuis TaxID=148309 RepID=A0AAD5M302_PARTN|nr:hypothetical protein KIN20_005997 [Parelaphostrongylus tenuis]